MKPEYWLSVEIISIDIRAFMYIRIKTPFQRNIKREPYPISWRMCIDPKFFEM